MEWDLSGVTVNADEILFIVGFEVTGPNEEALKSMNIAAYSDRTPQRTAGYQADTNVWARSDGGNLVNADLISGSGEPEFFNATDFGPEFVDGWYQVMSRFEGRPL
jgi:hypothetical protein